MPSDAELVRAAIEAATGGSVPRFALLVDVHHSQLYRWLDEARAVPPWLVRLCGAIAVDHAHVVAALEQAAGITAPSR